MLEVFFEGQHDVLTPLIQEYLTLEEIAQFCALPDEYLSREPSFTLTQVDITQFRAVLQAVVNNAVVKLVAAGVDLAQIPSDTPALALSRTIDRLRTEKALLLQHALLGREERTALSAMEPNTVENIIALNTLFDEINMENFNAAPLFAQGATKITLSELALTRIPEELVTRLQSYPHLVELDLRQNCLCWLPGSFGNFTALTSLALSSNQLTTLPESLGDIDTLTTLRLAKNKLTGLPESFRNLTRLTTLDLSINGFTTIPSFLGDFTALTSLALNNNKLTELPESLGNLTALTELYIGGNQLTTLPAALANLSALYKLLLGNNRFNTLPESMRSILIKTKNKELLSKIGPSMAGPAPIAPAFKQALQSNDMETVAPPYAKKPLALYLRAKL